MPVTRDQSGAYAPPSAILGLVERHRNKGLPSPVNAEVLERAGIAESLINRVLQSMQVLDLITEDGKPSPVLEGIRTAPEAEYKQRLTEWLNSVYADALTFVDPATDDEVAIRDAFRAYKPVGQQGRMVTLFQGLFTAAGVIPERQKQPPVRKVSTASTAKPRTAAKPPAGRGGGGGGGETKHRDLGGVPPALAGVLHSLPPEGGGWTKAERDKFDAAFGAMLDFCYRIVADEAPQTNTAGGQ